MHIFNDGNVEPKLVADWNKEESHLSNLKCQGLYIIIKYVTTDNIYLVSYFKSSKEVWDFL